MRVAPNKSVNEKGQALILVLILLLVGALIITPLLSYMGTGLKTGQVYEKKTDGLYAADAGVEDALWRIKYSEVPTELYPLTELVNEMSVSVVIKEDDYFYGLEVGGGGNDPLNWIVVLKSELVDNPSDPDYLGDYTYRLILTNKHNRNVGVGAIKISFPTDLDYPAGYQVYGLYDGDVDGLNKGSFDDGELTVTESGDNQILTWDFDPGETIIDGNPSAVLSDPETWVTVSSIFQLEPFDDAPEISNFIFVANPSIGTVWEFKPFRITSTAQDEDGSTVVIKARVFKGGDTVLISSWQIE